MNSPSSQSSTFGTRVRAAFAALFGEFNWKRPRWLQAIAGGVQSRFAALSGWGRTNPLRALISVVALLALIAAASFGWRWYESRPQPVAVAYEVHAPGLTCYACEPVGEPEALYVRFESSVAPLEGVGHTLDEKTGISLRPKVAGRWTWEDDKTLAFQPEADWPIGQRFDVTFAKRGVFAEQTRLKEYAFSFSAPAFEARIAATEFHQDPAIASNKKVVASFSFTHPVDVASFEERIALAMFDRVSDKIEKKLAAPSYHVVYDKPRLNAYVHTAQLEVPPKAGRLQVEIAAGVRAARGGNKTTQPLKTSVEIPGLNSLKVTDVSLDIVRNERNEPDQVVLINTSFSVGERDLPQAVRAWLLPTRHPDPKVQEEFERRERGQPFAWNETNFRPQVLQDGNRLELTQIPGERDHYELHSLRYQAAPGRYVYIKIDAGLKSFGGYVLDQTVERILQVPEFPRELSLMHQGALLAMSGDKTLSVFARNVPGMRFEIGRLLPNQLQHLVSQTYGDYAKPSFHNWAFDAANLVEPFRKVMSLPPAAPGEAQYTALNLGEYLSRDSQNRRGIFLLRVVAWDPDKDIPLEYAPENWNGTLEAPLADARLLVVTDIGMIVKRSVDGAKDVYVQSIATGQPLAGVTVEVIGRNGLPVATETSDASGHVRFPDFEGFTPDRAPTLYIARLDGDTSFLPFGDRDRWLDMSRFDVGGAYTSTHQGGLAAYLFSDRGIYRPGEQIRAASIVRSEDWRQQVQGLPLRLEIIDPQGTTIRRETYKAGAAGFGEILHDTKETSPTGTYTIMLSIVRDRNRADMIGSTTVQVRDFQPDRLRMRANFSSTSLDGWVSPEDLSANVSLENLFGTPAENRRITARLTLSPSIPSFRKYPDYRFHDPQYAQEGYSEQLADTTTNAKGEATFDLNLQRFARATYRAHLVVEGFEADGGRGVTAETAQLVSNMPFLVGYKADGDLDYLPRNGERNVHFIAIGPKADRIAASNLTLAHLETRFVSVLMRQPNGTYKYESRKKETPLSETPLTIGEQGFGLRVATDRPGSFVYVVRDAEGQQLARFEYQVAGDGNLTRTLEKNAELQMQLSKRDYAPGEEIEISIRAPYAGAGLISIERERVYATKWFKAETTSSVQRIRLPEGLEGNAYVTVTFVRDAGSPEIYTSPLSYGVQPFSIDIGTRLETLKVDAPTLVKPGQDVTFRYSSARPTRMVLFAVDEGILQVAGYRTPDPLGHFFRKRALEVSTMQILDLILPEFRHFALTAAPGGDAESALGKHLNPFRRKGEKPVAYWSGIVDADATPRELKYTVPDYFNGTLRVIAVAVSDARIGVHDSRTLVRGDFVLSPNAPTTVTPGDEFDISLGVANNVEGSGADASIAVTLDVDKGLEIVGDKTQQVRVGEGREGSVRFRLRARDELGSTEMRFTASHGATRGTRRIDLSIRPATPYMTVLKAGVFQRGDRDVKIDRALYPHHRQLEAGVSVLPLQFAHGFAAYLENYPYACTEQIVSQALPAVLLGSRPEFGYVRSKRGGDIADLLSELRSRQNYAGAYKLWPGSEQVVEFVAVYTQHALIEAAERGHAVPSDVIDAGNRYLRTLAQRDGDNLADERHSAYAIYVLTRQGQRMGTQIAALRQRLEERYKGEWEQDIAAAWLAASMKLMRQDRDAETLLKRLRFDAQSSNELYNDAMTRDAFLMFVTARHFPELVATIPGSALQKLAERVDQGLYHSLSAGTTLLALDAYAGATQTQQTQLSIAEVLKNQSTRKLALPDGLLPQVAFTEDATALRFTNGSQLDAFYLVEQSGFDRTPPAEAIKRGLEVIREYTDESGKAISSVRMGDQVTVRLKFRGLKDGGFPSVALVDLLPGGFELVVPPRATNEEDYDEEGYEGWTCQICVGTQPDTLHYADLREDRVVFYAYANSDVAEISYRIKATNAGTFVTPPAYGEAMYDRTVVARSTAGRIEVKRPE